MKLIDEKGKFFGLVNVIDLMVIILIIAIIGGIGYKMFSSKINANGGNITTEKEYVYVTLYASLVVPEVVENLHIGDKLVADNGFTDAEIVSIESKPAAYVTTDSTGKMVLTEHPLWKDVIVVIKEKVNPSSVILKVGKQEVRINYPFILKTQIVEANSKIRGVDSKTLTGKVLE